MQANVTQRTSDALALQTDDQRACVRSLGRVNTFPRQTYYVRTANRIEPLRIHESVYHREALRRWIAEYLMRHSGDLSFDQALIETDHRYASERGVAFVCRLSGQAPEQCLLAYNWTAEFERTTWCARANQLEHSDPGAPGMREGSLVASVCLDPVQFSEAPANFRCSILYRETVIVAGPPMRSIATPPSLPPPPAQEMVDTRREQIS